MNRFHPAYKFRFSLLRAAEDGGGGGDGDSSSGAVAVEGEGEAAATVATEPSPPATTFLSEAAKAAATTEGEAAEGKAVEPPAPFDPATLTLPEGLEMTEELGKSLGELLNDPDMSAQERGQKLIDLHASTLKTVAESLTQANMELWKTTNDDWRNQIKELPEFKDNPDAEAGKIMQALTSVGAGEEFFKALDLTGAGNHPAILQVFHWLTKPYIEGGAVNGMGGPKTPRQLGANIYTSAAKG